MATHLTQSQRRLIIQDENLDIHHQKAVTNGKSTISKLALNKGGMGFGNQAVTNGKSKISKPALNEGGMGFGNQAVTNGKSKSSKPALNKAGTGFGNRKALNDITNKSSLHPETSSRKKNLPKDVPCDFAEEMFLHDHKKCIEARLTTISPSCFLDMVFPGHDSGSSVEFPESKLAKDSPPSSPLFLFVQTDIDSPCRYPSTNWDSLPSCPFAWEFEPVEFQLKQEDC
ncbi:protein PATRONUS 2 [Cornus florida]|uniref:protein PATRONUS 2 n=1 Tax=Cornus florida TaxID=4283 RepID=UPI0028A03E50|nr:protein PATRONUS 2 [Cornus florida]